MRFEASFPVPRYGLATSFGESETPKEYALRFRNRFINNAGSAEKRQGMEQIYDTVPGTPNLTGIHEMVRKDGTSVKFVSGEGKIWRLESDDSWTQVHSGWTAAAIIKSVQMDNRLIFFNGVERNIYFEDKTGALPGSSVKELKAVIAAGELGGAVSASGADDVNFTNWPVDSDAAVNDIVFNQTLNAYGLVNAVTSANITHSVIGSAATGLGQATRNQEAGDRYQLLDLVELNIIPTAGEDDNTATAGPGTDATHIAVSGVNFSLTDVKAGDFVSNTSRSSVALVSSVATALTVTSVASQAAGDSLVFLKSAMPVASDAHVHYGRLYLVDARDNRKIRISGPNDSQDFTTDTGLLDTNTYSLGNQQPQGDVIKAISSYQRFLVVGGNKNVLLYAGTDPIQDTTVVSTDFVIVGAFPQGCVSSEGMVSLGNDLAFMSPDGVQTVAQVADASDLGRENISEAIKTTLREEVGNASEDAIQMLHYPKRSWLVAKVGSQIFVFNYSETLKKQASNARMDKLDPHGGSWSLFDGKCARQNAYFITHDGTFLIAGAGGKVYEFDADGVYADDGEAYTTEYQTPWLEIPKNRTTRTCAGNFIRPILDAGAAITYTIRAEGDFAVDAQEEITVSVSGGSQPIGVATIAYTIGGTSLDERKYGLRWRGRRARFTFTTNDTMGPDVISRFTVYGNIFGVR